ncbi:MAG TPA: bifunctional proline dehydrogenase/L-glutamate gamma-semialdehyde dehydrogenase PutA [Burkholderiales bacterium]|nr:bifunctional proline dehydrogenase/L-glutamate gamma-semialdehyde dehydrogenase PutA [Burkholderiales bacterium]
MAAYDALKFGMGAPDLPLPESWLPRARSLALALAEGERARGPWLDVQRLFSWLPPDEPLGEGLFRLAEALPRTPDRASRRALLREHVPFLRAPAVAALALPLAEAGLRAVARQFVYAESIEAALAQARDDRRHRFSFDMLGEGARTAEDAARGFSRYARAIAATGRAGEPQRLGVSIKLSSLHPRFDACGYPAARALLLERVAGLCASAARAGIGLTIDAEESERAPLQLDLFAALARRPELLAWDGLGIVVQAYRTGALETLREVLALARLRREAGGAALAVRLVKGAYWDAEVKRAQELGLDGYPVFTAKGRTDLAYVAAARALLDAAGIVFPQFATHNPVTVACIVALSEARPPCPFEFQRLHGMGEGLDAAMREQLPALPVRVYAPVGERQELLAYLVRRLLENGASTSHVRQAARSSDPGALVDAALAFAEGPPPAPRLPDPTEILMPERRLARGPDLGRLPTLERLAKEVAAAPKDWLAPVADGDAGTARQAIDAAYAYRDEWARTPVEQRAAALERLADRMEADTPRLVALCVREAGKTLADAHADVREAIDFCRYYAGEARRLFVPLPLPSPAGERNELTLHGRGVFACISPWNFPVAIFTGQVAAALAAGNTVVAKPAEQTPRAALRVTELALEAGIPAQALHLVPGRGEEVGQALVDDPRVAGVAFTGSNATAKAIQLALARRDGPIAPLIAETGGLNAMLVDSTALPEQVVDAVVASAFRSAGQRCSSLRMLYLQEEIAPVVLELLRGAMAALRVGDPADPATDVGPLIDEEAHRALSGYVVQMRAKWPVVGETPLPARAGNFLAPVAFEVGSIRDLPGERFGPILHVARFRIGDLDRVIDDVNACGFGLTMGIHTRLQSRAEQVRRRARVGNLYVNRNIIGAVVGMQPFGGEGLSGTGPKAGGPHYLPRFALERTFTVNTAAAGGDLSLVTSSL